MPPQLSSACEDLEKALALCKKHQVRLRLTALTALRCFFLVRGMEHMSMRATYGCPAATALEEVEGAWS